MEVANKRRKSKKRTKNKMKIKELKQKDLEEIMEIIAINRIKTGDCMCRTENSEGESYCASIMTRCPYINIQKKCYTWRTDIHGKHLIGFYGCKYQPKEKVKK